MATIERIDMRMAAGISPCGKYRYWLSREWGAEKQQPRVVCFLMLNPSTADAFQDDPTIRRCIGFARAWGFDRLEVRNLFSLRATNPDELYAAPDPVGGEEADAAILFASMAERVVFAWGTHGTFQNRDKHVIAKVEVARRSREPAMCLGLTKDGHPRHPLYVRADFPPIPFIGKAGGQ